MNEGTGYFFGSWLAALLSPPLNTYLFLFLIFLFMFFLFLVHRSFRDKMSSGNRVNIKRLYWGSMIIMGGSLILVLAFILIGVESIRKAEVKSTEEYLDSISRSTVIMMDNYLTRNLSFVTLEAGKEGLAERAGALAGLPGDRETLLGSEELSLFYD